MLDKNHNCNQPLKKQMDKPSSVSPVAEKASSSKDNQGNIEKEPRNEDSMSNEIQDLRTS